MIWRILTPFLAIKFNIWSAVSDALSGGLGTAIGGALGFLSGERRNSAQQGLSREQMAFQERMSNTAVQRRQADLAAAGINPILAGRYDASSPPGAMAQLENPAIAASTALSAVANATVQNEQVDQVKAQTKNIIADTRIKNWQQAQAEWQAVLARSDFHLRNVQVEVAREELKSAKKRGQIDDVKYKLLLKGLEMAQDTTGLGDFLNLDLR